MIKNAALRRAMWTCALGALPLLGAAPSASAAGFGARTLHQGARGHDVRVLQSWLTHLGYRTAVDGAFGGGTRRSVRRFEHHERIRVDGVVSPRQAALMRRLMGRLAAEPAPVPGAYAVLARDGRTAIAPAEAPLAVKQAIAAANEITHTRYRYGGGHGRGFNDTAFDCSGAVSHALHGAALVTRPLDSTQFKRWGRSGRGLWITVYANSGHAYAVIAGLRFDTSGRGESGPRWRTERRSSRGYVARHPAGL